MSIQYIIHLVRWSVDQAKKDVNVYGFPKYLNPFSKIDFMLHEKKINQNLAAQVVVFLKMGSTGSGSSCGSGSGSGCTHLLKILLYM